VTLLFQLIKQRRDRRVQASSRLEEALIAKARHYPTLSQQHAPSTLAFSFGLCGSRGGRLLYRSGQPCPRMLPVDRGIIETGLCVTPAFQIVAHHLARNAAKTQRQHMVDINRGQALASRARPRRKCTRRTKCLATKELPADTHFALSWGRPHQTCTGINRDEIKRFHHAGWRCRMNGDSLAFPPRVRVRQ